MASFDSNRYSIFLHNWVQSVAMDTAWSTAVNPSAETLTEERRSLWARPKRTLSVKWNSLNQDEAHRLFFLLHRLTFQDRLYVPLYQDVSRTTANSSVLTINCPTTDRRFTVGQVVVIHGLTDGRPSNVQFGVISAVNPASLGLSATLIDDGFTGVSLTGVYPAGSIVYPIVETQRALEGGGSAITDYVGDLPLTLIEIDDSKIPPSANWEDVEDIGFDNSGTVPGGHTYRLFDMPMNWAREVGFAVSRSGAEMDLGRGHTIVPRGPRGQSIFRFTCERPTRAEAYRLIQFFDAHRGMLVPFFVANPFTIYSVQNIGTGFIDVTRSGPIDDTLFVSFAYLEMTNGDVYVRAVGSYENNAGLTRLLLAEDLPDGLLANDVRRATTAHLCRFKSDALHEEWVNNTIGTISVEVQEVLLEQEVVLT